MGIIKEYRKTRTLAKGIEPAGVITGIAMFLTIILKAKGIEITEADALQMITAITAASSGLYGAYRMFRNWLKNRKK